MPLGLRSTPRRAAWTLLGVVMALPLVAMQVSDEVNWGAADFAAFAGMLVGAGLVLELAARRRGGRAFFAGVVVALAAALLLVASIGAVGIVGSEHHPANRVFYAVPTVAGLGALLSGPRPAALARAMLATALAQILVAAIVLAEGLGAGVPDALRDILAATGVFTLLWLLSAFLFLRAGRRSVRC